MHILVVTIPELGHINPMLPTLRRLQNCGHRLTLATPTDLRRRLDDEGLHAIAHRVLALSHLHGNQEAPPPSRGAAFAAHLADPPWLARWIEALLIGAVPAWRRALEALLDDTAQTEGRGAVDVVLADPMLYAVPLVCAQRGLPWLGLSSSLNPVTPPSWECALTSTIRNLEEQRNKLFADVHQAPPHFRVSDALSPWGTVCFVADAFLSDNGVDGQIHAPLHCVGAPFTADDLHHATPVPPEVLEVMLAHRRNGGRLAYASFGSQAFYQPHLFNRIANVCAQQGLGLVASLGDLVDDDDFVGQCRQRLGNTPFVPFRTAPQLALLKHVDVVITHGGANTAVEAIWHGSPMVVLPLCNDQHLVARFILRAGVGSVVEPVAGDVDEDLLTAALTKVLSAPVGVRCRALADHYQSLDGPGAAASILEAAVKTFQARHP